MKMNLQLFGGRGGRSGGGGGGARQAVGTSAGQTVASFGSPEQQADRAQRERDANAVERASFKVAGNGTWDLETARGGAQILDETGTSWALRSGYMPNEKVYSIRVWTYGANGVTTANTSHLSYDTLNEAKRGAKRRLADMVRGNAQIL